MLTDFICCENCKYQSWNNISPSMSYITALSLWLLTFKAHAWIVIHQPGGPTVCLLWTCPFECNVYISPCRKRVLCNWARAGARQFADCEAANKNLALHMYCTIACMESPNSPSQSVYDNARVLWPVAVCNRTLYGDVGKTYELELQKPLENRLPFLCHLTFTANGHIHGDLVQVGKELFALLIKPFSQCSWKFPDQNRVLFATKERNFIVSWEAIKWEDRKKGPPDLERKLFS